MSIWHSTALFGLLFVKTIFTPTEGGLIFMFTAFIFTIALYFSVSYIHYYGKAINSKQGYAETHNDDMCFWFLVIAIGLWGFLFYLLH